VKVGKGDWGFEIGDLEEMEIWNREGRKKRGGGGD
jgi:hypothetical protein